MVTEVRDFCIDDEGHDLDADDRVKVISSRYNLDTNWSVLITPCHGPDVKNNVTLCPVTLTLTIKVMTLTPAMR